MKEFFKVPLHQKLVRKGKTEFSYCSCTCNGKLSPGSIFFKRELVHGPTVSITLLTLKSPFSVCTVTTGPGTIPITLCRSNNSPPCLTNSS